jgi:hypothetical protein
MGLLLFFFLAHQIRERVDPFRESCRSGHSFRVLGSGAE